MRGEFRIKCLLSVPQMQGLHSPFSPSAVMKPGATEAVGSMQNFGLGKMPPDTKDLISLHSSKEYVQLTCGIVGSQFLVDFRSGFGVSACCHGTFPSQGLRRGFRMHTGLVLSSLFFFVCP
jgi:hypothetical protein